MIEKIARDILHKLNAKPSRHFDSMVGVEAHLREIQSLLNFDYDGVKFIAIYGPAGIGKTTIARALHSRLSDRFQLTCFVDSLRESYPICLDEYGLKLRLQQRLLTNILNQDGTRTHHVGTIKERLHDLKVLIILDDVNNVKQLEALAYDTTWFGPGSRIIVTTENKELSQRHGINNTYHVEFPSDKEALEILCRYVFRKSSPCHGFEKLATEVTKHCGNLPLGLLVVGSCLHGKNRNEWEYMIHKLKTNIDQDIEDILRVGYESLDNNEQTLFLHIAVFFNNENGDLVKAMLADNNLDIEIGLKNLVDKSLIYISTYGEIVMHRLLQQVGRQAIHRQEPWKRHILIDTQEICDVLENQAGTRAMTGISFDTSGIDEVILCDRAFRRMCNLRFLRVYKTKHYENGRVRISEEMEFPPRLRLLHWEAYPSKSLPPTFYLQNLLDLHMPFSKLEKLWEGTLTLRNLKKMDLSWSIHLKELPDLSNATNMEELDLSFCRTLVELPSSIGNLHKLEDLQMDSCKKLQVIPPCINLESLKNVSMIGCSQLKSFPNISANIRRLVLIGTGVEEIPTSISLWTCLQYINMSDNGNLKSLAHFPKSVEWIDLSYTDIDKIPNCIKGFHRLEGIRLDYCKKLKSLPELPNSIKVLSAQDCESLESLTCPLNTPNARLNFTNCFNLNGEARKVIIQQSFRNSWAFLPGKVMPSEFSHKAKGNSLTIRLSSAASAFKVCLMISLNHHQSRRECRGIYLQFQIIGARYFYEKMFSLHNTSEATGIRTEHVCVFHGDMPGVSSEVLFEFHIRSDHYDNSWYKPEVHDVLRDSEGNNGHSADGLISCDLELDNVEGKNKHTDTLRFYHVLGLCFR